MMKPDLTRERGEELAQKAKGKPPPKELENIPPSLLSAEHIRDFVMSTGLISPFDGQGERLKKASYEGRIGEKAFVFEGAKLVPATFNDNKLYIAENSIVFVESDLDFRLPEYIAMRFNLHIEHVHRGLLLGTGPLVDPGFWGKLCIPLHNLTSEPYEISRETGLFWVEFTRTTSAVDPKNAIGRAPSNTGYWDIEKFIQKAARGVGGSSNVPIQSSIGGALLASKYSAEEARDAALDAASYTRRWTIAGALGVLGLIISAAALVHSAMSSISAQVQVSKSYVDVVREDIANIQSESREADSNHVAIINRLEAELKENATLEAQVDLLKMEIEQLTGEIRALSSSSSPALTPNTTTED